MSISDQTPETIAQTASSGVDAAWLDSAADHEPEADISDESPAPSTPETPMRKSGPAVQFVTAAIISFSLTLLAGSGAILGGLIPLGQMGFSQRVDLGAVLLFAPLCALVLALLFETAVMALKAPLHTHEPRRVRVKWSPGQREG